MKETKTKTPAQQSELGLTLNPKTMLAISGLLLSILIFVGVLTQVLPRGEYQMTEVDGHMSIVNDTYSEVDFRLPIWKIVLSPVLCFTSSQASTGIAIILIIFFLGGSFLILDKVGVLKYMMAALIRRFSERKYLLMGIVIFACMLLSSTAGVLEEALTLVPIAVAISLALGWDSFVGLGISLVSVAWGFTAATFNPFNVVTVQKLSDVPVFSGLWLRLLIFLGVYAILYLFLFLYAKRIEKHPETSLTYESDKALREKYTLLDMDAVLADTNIKKATRAFLLCIGAAMLCIAADFALSLGGMLSLPGMALMFTIGGLIAGYITNLRGKALLKSFLHGAKAIASAVPLIVFVLAISYVLNEGKIMHTLLYQIYQLMQNLSPASAIFLLFLVIAVLEFFIGSGTAKAFLVMPLVAPLSDLVGITRQSVVTTFCLADGFTNLLYPTSSIMIIAIGLVGISYGKWLRWSWKLFLAEFAFSAGVMLLMVAIHYT